MSRTIIAFPLFYIVSMYSVFKYFTPEVALQQPLIGFVLPAIMAVIVSFIFKQSQPPG